MQTTVQQKFTIVNKKWLFTEQKKKKLAYKKDQLKCLKIPQCFAVKKVVIFLIKQVLSF